MQYSLIDHQFGENQVAFVENWIIVFMVDCFVHQRMRSDEIQDSVG